MPDAVFLHEHEAVVELERSVVECADVGVDVGVFANNGDTFPFIGMTEVRHDNFHIRVFCRDRVEMTR